MISGKWLGTLFALAFLPFATYAADISGTWKASFQSPMGGAQDYTYTFIVKDGQLTGTAKSSLAAEGAQAAELKDGKVVGDQVSFVEMGDFQGIAVTMTYSGMIVSDDEIKLKRDLNGMVVEQFTATRVK